MKSASQMSQLIRASKKLKEKDEDMLPEIGMGSMDLQDASIAKSEEATDDMDENHPMSESELAKMNPAEEEMSKSDSEHKAVDDEQLMKRKMRIAAMMSK